jgi:uncharacterized protein YjbI with pentapeptide repeats
VDTQEGQALVPSWLTCSYGSDENGIRCIGRQVDGFDHCLEHLEPEQLNEALGRVGPGIDVDASGTAISAELLDRILGAVVSENGSATFGSVCFSQARFHGPARFVGARFNRDACFTGAQFTKGAVFDNAQFSGTALFIDARVGHDGDASFADTLFGEGAWFDGVRFGPDTNFKNAVFEGNASFVAAQFDKAARFSNVNFRRNVTFDGANFSGGGDFSNCNFSGDVGFDGAWFGGTAGFINARFDEARRLGPLAASSIMLTGAVFGCHIMIEAVAVFIICNKTSWKTGVTMRLRYAQVELKHAKFTKPSFIIGVTEPFGLTPGFRHLDESKIQRSVTWERPVADDSWIPIVLSLRGTDKLNLCTTAVDLSKYRTGFRLMGHLCWLAIRGIGRGAVQLLRVIGEFVWDEIKDALEHLLEGSALGVGSKLLTLLKLLLTLPAVAAFVAWLFAGYHWTYTLPIFVGTLIAIVLVFLRRKRIADKFSLPMRLRYSHDSGWYASHAHTIVGPHESRRTAISELFILRQHLRQSGLRSRGSFPSYPLSDSTPYSQVQHRLQAWSSFPTNRAVRPLVLLSASVRMPALLEEKSKAALSQGLIEAVPGFPIDILHALRDHLAIGITCCEGNQKLLHASRLSTGLVHYNSLTFSLKRHATADGINSHQPIGSPVEPLLLTIAKPGMTHFLTDRGRRELPAWEVRAQGIQGSIWVLDPDTSRGIWRPPGLGDCDLHWGGSVAQLTTDQSTIAMSFYVIADEYSVYPGAGALEFAGAVAIIPVPMNTRLPDSHEPNRKPYKQTRELSARLIQPIGPRVLLDGNGFPVVVCD